MSVVFSKQTIFSVNFSQVFKAVEDMKEECKLGTVPPQAAVSRAVGKVGEYSGFQLPSTS